MSKKLKKAEEPEAFTRREIIGRVATTSIVGAATLGVGAWLLGREPERKTALATIADHRVSRPAGATELAIVRGGQPREAVRRVLEAMGGMSAFVRPGERVVIKPNVGWNRLPAQAANTHPDIVEELVRQARGAGAAEVWVCDIPVNDPERCFTRSGIGDATKRAEGTLVLPSKRGFRAVAPGGTILREAQVLWPFVEADRVINVPIVKQHGLSGATISMKNWYGVLGGHQPLHQNLARSIVELAAMMKPTLTVLDATRVMMSNGPSGGSLDDVRRYDIVAAAVDEVALDAFGVGLLEQRLPDVEFVGLAEAAGLGTSDYRRLKTVEMGG